MTEILSEQEVADCQRGADTVEDARYRARGMNPGALLLRAEAAEARLAEVEAERDEALELVAAELVEGPQTESEAMARRLAEVEQALRAAKREHYYCDDCWYSCPKAVDGCCDDSQGDECNCGADAWNARIAAVLDKEEPTSGEQHHTPNP